MIFAPLMYRIGVALFDRLTGTAGFVIPFMVVAFGFMLGRIPAYVPGALNACPRKATESGVVAGSTTADSPETRPCPASP